MNRRSTIALMALLPWFGAREALAAAAPRIPSSAMPGRERDQLFGRPSSQPPLIERQNQPSKPVKRRRRKRKP